MTEVKAQQNYAHNIYREKLTNLTSISMRINASARVEVARDLSTPKHSKDSIDGYVKKILTMAKKELDTFEDAHRDLVNRLSYLTDSQPIRAGNNGYRVKDLDYGSVKLPGNGKNKFWVPISVRSWDEQNSYHINCGIAGRVYIDKKKPVGERIWIQSIGKKHAEYHTKETLDNFKLKALRLFTEKFFDAIPKASHSFKWVIDSKIEYGVIVPSADLASVEAVSNDWWKTAYEKKRVGVTFDLKLEKYKVKDVNNVFLKDANALSDPNSTAAMCLILSGKNKSEAFIFTEDTVYKVRSKYQCPAIIKILKQRDAILIKQDTWWDVIDKQTTSVYEVTTEVSQEVIDQNEFFGHFLGKLTT